MPEQEIFYRRHLPHWQPREAAYHVTFRLKGSLPAEAVERLRAEREEAEKALLKIDNEDEKKKLFREFHWSQFHSFDALLEGSSTGPTWLKQPKVAVIVQKALHFYDRTRYDLLAYTIMPNHVHVVTSVGSPDPTEAEQADGTGVGLSSDGTGVGLNSDGTGVGLNSDGTGVPSYYILTDIFGSIKKYTARRANAILHRSGALWQDESYDHVIRTNDELDRTIRYVLNNPVKAGLVESWEQWPWSYIKPGLIE